MAEGIRKFPIPVSYFGIVLGLFSLGLAWRYVATAMGMTSIVSNTLLTLGAVIWVIFLLSYIYKAFIVAEQAWLELKHPVQGCFVSLIPITTILLGVAIIPHSHSWALGIIILGIVVQLLFASYHSAGLWRGTHVFEATTPIVYLPTVASNFAAAIGMGSLGYIDWGYLFLGAGIFSWLSLEAVILQRLRTREALNKDIRPILGIQLAPAFVGCAAYLAVNGGHIDIFAQALIGYGLLNLFFLIRLFLWIFEKGFTPSLWAFSFGLGSMANVGAHLHVQYSNTSIGVLGLPLLWLGTILICFLIIGTIGLLAKGKFFVK